ncbi:2-hydroxy-3-oxopropionate reductase [Agreia bicolorata]|uniref:2-hydroxy-3-oxopropionate reductase n=2 Tax=Agreia bicolorata TaxID=110935 RepID=A0A1T4WWZ0_9MICO|nr:tartronate semialdehyde reductase [Agreia bicolorata]SKA81667.1 2-hydroxy-3-oxopropionate reductase [Agreia bicolorata]
MSETATIAFIGLGIMGSPMAVNLAKSGHHVIGYSRREASASRLIEAGGTRAESIHEAVQDADIVITMLPDSPEVIDVALGSSGIFDSAKRGALFIDMSSIAPSASRTIADEAIKRGIAALDAPVSGGEQGAIDGKLSIMVGGSAENFERALPYLQSVGTTVVHVGGAGAGQTVKVANQLIVAGNLQVLAEALVFLEAQGVDTQAGLQVLSGGLAGSTVMTRKGESMISRSFKPGFRIALHDKDLKNFAVAAHESETATPVGTLLAELFASAKAEGDGDLDHSAMFRHVERLSGSEQG